MVKGVMGPNGLEILQEIAEVKKFWQNLFDYTKKTRNCVWDKKVKLIKLQFTLFFGSKY